LGGKKKYGKEKFVKKGGVVRPSVQEGLQGRGLGKKNRSGTSKKAHTKKKSSLDRKKKTLRPRDGRPESGWWSNSEELGKEGRG